MLRIATSSSGQRISRKRWAAMFPHQYARQSQANMPLAAPLSGDNRYARRSFKLLPLMPGSNGLMAHRLPWHSCCQKACVAKNGKPARRMPPNERNMNVCRAEIQRERNRAQRNRSALILRQPANSLTAPAMATRCDPSDYLQESHAGQ